MIKLIALITGLVVVAMLLFGCEPAPGINYSQWRWPDTVKNLSTICPAAPPMTYPGHDPSADLAADFMVPDGGTTKFGMDCGWLIANWAINLVHLTEIGWHGLDFKVHYIGWQQHIWQTEQQFWKPMEDRGSRTQNHFDHVHVSMFP